MGGYRVVNARDLWELLKREDEIEIANFRVIQTVLFGVLDLAVIVLVGWVIGDGWHGVAQSGIQADIAIQRHYCSLLWYNAFQCHQASLAVRHDKARLFLASHIGLFIGIYLFATLLFARMYWIWWSYGSNETNQAHEVLAHTLNIATMQGSQQSSRNVAISIISMVQSMVTFAFVLIVLASLVGVAMSLI